MAASDHIHPGQLQMFMTPREIHSQYQALDGDRQEAGAEMETDDELYARKAQEARLSPGEYHEVRYNQVASAPGYTTLVNGASAPQRRHSGSSAYDSYDMSMAGYMDRKIDAHFAHMDHGESLYSSIARTGVQSPIHLSEQFGLEGKPMVAGGHHRLASQTEINPDQPIPVLHHEDFWAAHNSDSYT